MIKRNINILMLGGAKRVAMAEQLTRAGSQQLSIKVCDITGRIVKNFSISGDETTLDLSGMTSGIYVVNVNGCHSQRIIVK